MSRPTIRSSAQSHPPGPFSYVTTERSSYAVADALADQIALARKQWNIERSAAPVSPILATKEQLIGGMEYARMEKRAKQSRVVDGQDLDFHYSNIGQDISYSLTPVKDLEPSACV